MFEGLHIPIPRESISLCTNYDSKETEGRRERAGATVSEGPHCRGTRLVVQQVAVAPRLQAPGLRIPAEGYKSVCEKI